MVVMFMALLLIVTRAMEENTCEKERALSQYLQRVSSGTTGFERSDFEGAAFGAARAAPLRVGLVNVRQRRPRFLKVARAILLSHGTIVR